VTAEDCRCAPAMPAAGQLELLAGQGVERQFAHAPILSMLRS
jgi:hypothetical protein